MSATWLIIDFVAVFVAIALLIVRAKLNPALALVLGTIALGASTGVSLEDIAAGLNEGFGAIMAEVGLLISLGVIMGYLMAAYGAAQRIVEGILSLFGKRGAPYAFGLTLSSVTPAIYFDVLLVLIAPIAKRVAALSDRPVAALAGPVALGLAAGNALMVPGPAMLAYLGALKLSPGSILLPGLAVALGAVGLTIFLYLLLMEKLGWWDPARDEEVASAVVDPGTDEEVREALPSLLAAVAPVATVLGAILLGIVSIKAGLGSAPLEFLGSPVIALLLGVLVALAITIAKQGLAAQADIVERALETVGPILVVTAVAGSLGVIIGKSGMQDVLSALFEANRAIPLLIVWLIAAAMRMAIGGQTVAGLTAIGIIAPLVGELGLSPVLVILAAGAGGCFGGQFSDNAFWMLRSLFGLSTRGTLKTYTLAQSLLAVVTLALVLVADLFV